MDTSKFTYVLLKLITFFINNRGTSLTADTFISYIRLQYLIKKPPVLTKRATIILIKTESCNALLGMLLVCISSCPKSFLRYNV